VTDVQQPARALEGWAAASPEQLASTRRSWEAWNRRDFKTWIEGFTPDCEWYPSTVGAVEGGSTAIRGHDGLRAFARQAEEAWELFRTEVDDDLRRGNLRLVLGRVRARGRASGVETETPMFWVSEQDERNGTVWSKSFLDLDEALAAAAEREGGVGAP
jgi:ketosteroid isomerase-like protein